VGDLEALEGPFVDECVDGGIPDRVEGCLEQRHEQLGGHCICGDLDQTGAVDDYFGAQMDKADV